ncbi:DENN domain-containing protein 2B isoform X4 [Hydra vulgaris]|uniref:DENN domain-containing protein 2B isoform X4 n=1 Tax=Hydra vulgaris TaxID=6087 RepID=A0ABM4D521_HYDVU
MNNVVKEKKKPLPLPAQRFMPKDKNIPTNFITTNILSKQNSHPECDKKSDNINENKKGREPNIPFVKSKTEMYNVPSENLFKNQNKENLIQDEKIKQKGDNDSSKLLTTIFETNKNVDEDSITNNFQEDWFAKKKISRANDHHDNYLNSKNAMPPSNLNKIKSVSSPSLLSSRDMPDSGINEFDLVHKEKRSYIRNGRLVQKIKGKRNRKDKCVSLFEVNEQPFNNHSSRSFKEPMLKQDHRLTKVSEHLLEGKPEWFDHVFVITLKKGNDESLTPFISFQFPPQIDEVTSSALSQRIESIPQFCFPDSSFVSSFNKSETFSFVLTDEIGGRVFGYCRLIQASTEKYPEVYCIVSPHGLFALYSQVLEEVEKQRQYSSSAVFSFLKAVISHPLPKPAETITVSYFSPGGAGRKHLDLFRPSDSAIHEHVNLWNLFSTLPILMIIRILGCLFIEQKVVLVSASLSLLSSCCHGFISLMYPFEWEHTYIPVLPTKLIEIVCLPSPYLIGVLPSAVVEINDLPVEEVIVIDLDSKKILCENHHKNIFPKQIIQDISRTMDEVQKNFYNLTIIGDDETKMRNKIITEVFVEFYLQLIGHFEKFYICNEAGQEIFSSKQFYKASQTSEHKQFLKMFVATQAFKEFSSKRKKYGPAYGLFEDCFSDWKLKRMNGNLTYGSKFKDFLSILKLKAKPN